MIKDHIYVFVLFSVFTSVKV